MMIGVAMQASRCCNRSVFGSALCLLLGAMLAACRGCSRRDRTQPGWLAKIDGGLTMADKATPSTVLKNHSLVKGCLVVVQLCKAAEQGAERGPLGSVHTLCCLPQLVW